MPCVAYRSAAMTDVDVLEDDLSDVSEMASLRVTRVDGVLGPANGSPFLLMKGLPAGAVVKAVCETCDGKGTIREGNMKCPDCDGEGEVAKEQLSGKDRKALDDSEFVFPDERAFPITTKAGVDDAVSSWGRYKGDHTFDEFKAGVKRIVKANGWPDSVLPATWTEKPAAKEAAVPDDPTPSELVAAARTYLDGPGKRLSQTGRGIMLDALDVAKAVADGTMEMPGDAQWEANDAARGRTIAALLAQACSMLNDAQTSEMAEVNAGQADDSDDVWDLQCALDCLDSALAIVARFSVTEAQEATEAAANTMDTGADGLVAKAGKRLSDASIKHAAAARDHLTALLGDDDPAKKAEADDKTKNAGDGDEGDEMAVTKEEFDAALADLRENIVAEVAKALKTEPAAPAASEETAAAKAADGGTGEAAPDAAGAAGGGDAATTTAESDVLKSTLAAVMKEALQPLDERLAKIEAQPQAGGPFLATQGRHDGILGGAKDMQGVAKAVEAAIPDPAQRDVVMQQLGAAALADLYRGQ